MSRFTSFFKTQHLGGRKRTDLPLRVGWLVTPLSPFGGTLTHLRRWAEGLDPTRVQPTLFFFSPELHGSPEPDGPLDLPASLPQVCLPGLDLRQRDPRAAVAETVKALKAHNIQLLHSLFIGADLVGALSSSLARIPAISSVEGELLVSHLNPMMRRVLATSYRLLSPKFCAVTAVSRATAQAVATHLGPGAPQVEVLSPGIPLAPLRRHPLERFHSHPELGFPHVVTVGRIVPVKGLPLLVEAVERLADRLPHLRVTIVGDGPDRQPLEALIRSRRVDEVMKVTGWLPPAEVGRILETADVLVQPSYSEGLPWTALEAMSRGVAVIASDVGGLSELIVEAPDDARTGYIVPPNRSDRLTMAMADALVGDDALEHLFQLGKRARMRVQQYFSVEQEITQLTALYLLHSR